MRFATPNCPTCGEPARGTLETVPGMAQLLPPDKDGNVEYEGETKILWDEQKPVRDHEGKATLLCHLGHDWQSAMEDGQ